MAEHRFYIEKDLQADTLIGLPSGPARHAQVLRLQPGSTVTLFNGQGGQWLAEVTHMGRSEVQVRVKQHDPIERENLTSVTWALGMPTNDRMAALVEKATELGVARIQPLICERSVLRLQDERAHKKVAHWQAVATAACEQCGRNRLPVIAPVLALHEWLSGMQEAASKPGTRILLSVREPRPWQPPASAEEPLIFLSGPEGGLTESEEALAYGRGFSPVSVSTRTLRADTVPLMVLSVLTWMR